MAQKFDARQTISRDVLANLLGINGTELDDLLRALNKEVNAPLRIAATQPTPDSKINFQASEVEAADLAAKNASPVSSQIPSFPASTIDFQSGATTGGTFNISFPNSTVGFFRRVGFSLDASGTIQAIFSAEAASLGALANAGTVFVKGAFPIGWIDLEATAASPGRFKTAGSATNIIENKVGANNRVHRIIGGGGSGTGSGSGTGDDINALTFKASFTDLFADLPTDAVSAVDYTAGKTDSTTYDIVNSYHRLAYDATRTVTGTGVNMTLNLAPAFTIKAGDMLIVGSEARRIASITSQTVFALESAFSVNPSASASCLSQAVHSKDLNNFAGDGLAVSTAFPTTINQILMTYEDTSAINDVIFDANTVSVIGYSASSDGTNFTNVALRPQNLSDSQSILNLPTAGTNMYVRLFANKSSGSGSVNILGYKVFFHRDAAFADGALQNQAYCFTNGTGAEINCSAPVVTSGKTRLQTSFAFPVAVNPGTTNGSLEVYLNGQKIPRFVDSTLTPDASYKEIDQRTIELDQDYSGLALSLEVIQTVAVVDASDTNTTGVAQLQETMSEGLQGMVKTSQVLNATSNTGTPAVGTFHSTIVNRAAITDLTQDLKVRMGVERVMTQSLIQLQNEFGPNGELVWTTSNDQLGQIRFVGQWINLNDTNGQRIENSPAAQGFVEVTFYGTGLNVLTLIDNAGRDLRATVDGGSETGNLIISGAGVLNGRNYSQNVVVNTASNLSLGVHTVKLRVNASNVTILGFEILNETTSLRVNPGSSYLAGKKATTIAQQTVAHNSSFEAGTLGTRGGRVVVYQKADGTIAKAVQPVDAASATLASANHQNEEIARTYHFREFGAGRADDFSTNLSSASRAFTLDDGTTTLTASNLTSQISSGRDTISMDANGSFLVFTFVGTGLDITQVDSASGGSDSYTLSVDGGATVALPTAGSTAVRTTKLVSGLPYGTHTVRITRVTAATWGLRVIDFKVYQPKKPSTPAGAVELADYNVMADFVANATAGVDRISTGVLRKVSSRELLYAGPGTWGVVGVNVIDFIPGFVLVSSSTTGNYVEYTFWGTGFDLRLEAFPAASTTNNMTLNGVALTSANFPTAAFSTYGTGTGFNSSTGALDMQDAATTRGTGFVTSGLPLARYTVRMTAGTAAQISVNTIDVITPIHSPKSNLFFDLQNALPVGSNAISDNRKTTILKDVAVQQKAISQAVGFQVATTTSGSLVPVADLSVTHRNSTGRIEIAWSASSTGGGANAADFQIYVDGIATGPTIRGAGLSGSVGSGVGQTFTVNVSPGFHKIDLYWLATGGTMTLVGGRVLSVKEV